jgi:glutamate/tyrosine decarboxylase-like PLP-dependent enzyme
MDWTEDEWRAAGQQALDLAIEASTGWEGRSPGATAEPEAFLGSLADGGADVEALVAELRQHLLPAAAYNGHPRFFGYITASPLPVGVLGDLLTSAFNQNMGLWRLGPAATAIELQTVDWIKHALGYPDEAQGLFTSGGQMANVYAHAVMRSVKTPWDVRMHGMRGQDGRAPQLRIYASDQVHYCHQQAAELLGMGRDAVRIVPSDEDYRMRPDATAAMVAEDRARGDLPVAIAATAGTVGTGAIDPLPELLKVAQDEDLWLHVDGAYGAFAALASDPPAALAAMADADSIACDPHKWLCAPIDAGVTLVRRPGLLEAAFSFHPSYLATEGGEGHVDLVERSPENSRRLRALKVWLAARMYGTDGFGALVDRNIGLAAYMEDLIRATPGLEVAAPRGLSIVCWRARPAGILDAAALDRLQLDIIAELERRGIAFISNATVSEGTTAMRACIVNFRTGYEDVERTVAASAEIAQELAG